MSDLEVPYGGGALRTAPPPSLQPLTTPSPAPREVSWSGLARAALRGLEDLRSPCLVVPDRTRPLPLAPLVRAVRDALGERGAPAARLPVVFASGTHAPMTEAEIAARLAGVDPAHVEPIAHDCERAPFVALADGQTRVHARVAQASAVIAAGPLSFHYLAGFGGGRKLVLPGVADRATALAVHRTTLTDAPPGRTPGCEPGELGGNPMHRAIVARLAGLPPAAGLTVVLDGDHLTDGEAGPLVAHHARAAARFAAPRTVVASGPLQAGIVSAGGAPFDGNLVQAHKALRAVAPVFAPGARVALFARLDRGLGHADFLAWARRPADESLARLLRVFSIGEQTAWSLRTLLDTLDVGLVSDLDDDVVRALGATPLAAADVTSFVAGRGPVGYAPAGAARLYRVAT